MHRALFSLITMLMAVGCGEAKTDAEPSTEPEDQPVSLPVPEQGYQMSTPSYEVPPFSEVEICTVTKLEPNGDEKLYWVNSMESLVTEGTHHMNVFIGEFSFLDAFVGEGMAEAALGATLGQHLCSDIAMMELAYPIFPSQRENQRITLPAGVAAPMTAPLVGIFSHHYVNPTPDPVSINAVLNIETIDTDQVEHVAGLVFDDISTLEVAPGTDRVTSRTCVMERDVEVALVSSHNHEWGECATMNHYDGTEAAVESDPFFVNKAWEQPPILHFEPGSFSINAGDGVHWSCHYRNNTDRTLINDGTAQGEMCVFAAVTYPSPWTVEQVEEAVTGGDITDLIAMMRDVMGPCDSVIEDAESPWTTDDAGACESLDQTESNVLE